MSIFTLAMLAVTLLLDPSEIIDAEASAAISEDANRVQLPSGRAADKPGKTATITGRTSDFDREAGVVMFEGNVVVVYDRDYTLAADRVYAFMHGSNQLNRVVAVGTVSITNDHRVGTAPLAIYRRNRREIEMFGDGKGQLAHLVDRSSEGGELTGSRIRFWLDSEQVEVENSRIRVDQQQQQQKGNWL